MKKNKKECDLQSCFLCRNCIPEWHPLLQLSRTTFILQRGELLFAEGDEVKGIFFLEKGWMKVHQHWTDEKELIIRIASPGSIVGHRGIGIEPVYPVSATALEPCSVCFVDLDFFYKTLRMNTDLSFNLLLFFAEELRESELRMRNMARLPVKSRVAGALVRFYQKFGTTADGCINLPLSRQDIAAYVGATYETVFRMLQELSVEGFIKLNGKQIYLLKQDGLAQLADGYLKDA